jgi:2-dehydro-3-deoxyphosphogluconate aldolase/(4S)-4-hydroxy-2-oxoglutarate aldolase
MKNKQETLDSIIKQGMLPLFFYEDPEVCLEVVRTLYRAGVRVMEYTNRAKEAFENFKILKAAVDREMPDFLFGAGTIKTREDAIRYTEAGADLIVAPIINPEVGKIVNDLGGLWIPGCMTPTEIHTAQENGAALIKIFPANVLGPGFVSAVSDVFRGQLFMPTGGVDLNQENMSSWFKAGVCALGMGSKLISKQVLQNKLYDQLHADTVKALELIKISR